MRPDTVPRGRRRAAPFMVGLGVAAAVLLAVPPAGLAAQSREVRRIEEATVVFEEITAIPDKSVPDLLLRDSRAVVIVPGLLKAGFVVGGEFGRGVLLTRQEDGGWSNPVFVTLSGAGIGLQAGIRSTDLLLVFRTDRGVNAVLRGDLTLGVDLAAAAGPVGRQARASTDTELKAEIYSYSRSRGFFAGLSLDGSVLSVDDEANAAFYKSDELGPRQILRDPGLKAPGAANELRRVLQQYVDRLPAKAKATP